MSGEPDLVRADGAAVAALGEAEDDVRPLAGDLAVVGAMARRLLLYNAPGDLRIAVGPANSDDFKMVQTIAQVFIPGARSCPAAPGADRRRRRERPALAEARPISPSSAAT